MIFEGPKRLASACGQGGAEQDWTKTGLRYYMPALSCLTRLPCCSGIICAQKTRRRSSLLKIHKCSLALLGSGS